jgi:hypothetical protein
VSSARGRCLRTRPRSMRMPSLAGREDDSGAARLGTAAALGRVEAGQMGQLLPDNYHAGAGPDFPSSRGESLGVLASSADLPDRARA